MNCPRPLMLAALAALAVLGCSDTASAQPVLTVNPPDTSPSTPLTFSNIPSGGVSPAQNITVSTADSTMATVIIQVNPSSTWLSVTPGASVNIPATLSVACNTSTLSSGSYNGSFTITVDGAPTDSITVYVSLSVAGTSLLSASPATLAFSAQDGASTATPTGTQVQIMSSGTQLNYTLQAQTESGGTWLLLSAESGSTAGPPFTVSVNPSGLVAASFPAVFNGIITASSTTTLDAVQIPVQVTLSASAELSVTPTSPPPFLYQFGTAADPAPQQLAISSAGGSITFGIQESPAVSWLVLSALGGTAGSTPDTITLNATPVENSLQPGTYTTGLLVTPSGEAALPAVPITLVVAAHPLLQLSTNSLSFTASFAGTLPAAQAMTVTGSGGASVGFTVSSSASWLTVTPSTGTTPATLTVQVNPSGLTTQTYTGTLTLSPTNGDPYTETITVSLSVSASAQLVAGPGNLLFSYEIAQSPPESQTIDIATNGQPVTFTVAITATTCGSGWLAASASSLTASATSSATLTVAVVTNGITTAETCSGTITLNYSGGVAPANLSIQVTLAVSSSAELSVNTAPGFGIASATQGSAPFQQQISLTSTNPTVPVSYTASLMNVSGGAWLGLVGSSTIGTTPQNIDIQYNPAALTAPGTYTGTVVITSNSWGFSQFTIPVSLTVTTITTVSVTPASLSFTEAQGGSPPAAQTLTLSSMPGPATYTAAITYLEGANWLQISSNSGNANSSVQVSVAANTLSQGSYQAQISFAFQDAATASATVNVVLNVTAVTASPSSLSFTYQIGGTQPSPQPLSVASSTGGAVAISVSATSSGWLSVGTTSGSTPQTISVSVNPAGLAAKTYSGSISISAPGVLTTPLSIPVSLSITSPPMPQPFEIINNATGVAGVIAPGEEIAIKGTALGPSSPSSGVLFSVDSSGGVSSTLAGVQVLFNNNPGTPIFVSADQIDVMVPYEINGLLSATMVVTYNGVASAPFPLSVALTAPGLFTDNFSGQGQVAAINQNNTVNGTGSGYSAASPGTVIALYGSGGGQTDPISTTGSITPIPTSASELLNIPNVTATVGGLPATVQFAGEAPGDVTGVFQVNVLIPANVTPGSAVPVTIAIGGISSPLGTTIAVQ
jgi:uncharacterized protein (TIGR03437 family)